MKRKTLIKKKKQPTIRQSIPSSMNEEPDTDKDVVDIVSKDLKTYFDMMLNIPRKNTKPFEGKCKL